MNRKLSHVLEIRYDYVGPRHDWKKAMEAIFDGATPAFNYADYLAASKGLSYKPSALECAMIRYQKEQKEGVK